MPKIIYIHPKLKWIISISVMCVCIFSTLLFIFPGYFFNAFAKTEKSVAIKEQLNVRGGFAFQKIVDKMLTGISQTDITEPKKMMATQLLGTVGKAEWYENEPEKDEILVPAPLQEQPEKNLPKVDQPALGNPVVGIYCTHNAETYLLTDKVEKVDGRNGGVMKVAITLKDALQARGIGAVCDSTIHDYPNWTKSYSNSLHTIKRMQEKYPGIKIFIDVHRDASPSRENSVTVFQGQKYAKLSFIVGSDARMEHPKWRENWSYANFLAKRLESASTGVLKGVRVQSGRYNQHVTTHSILIEVGSTKNSLEEAERTATLFANVLADTILNVNIGD